MTLRLTSGKRELLIDPPCMNAAGFLGFSGEAAGLVDLSWLGALVTHPISLAPRAPARGPRVMTWPGGFLLHTGFPNPGVREVLRRHRRRWAGLSCPVILHLLAGSPQEAALLAERLETVEGAAGIELGLEPVEVGQVRVWIAAAERAQLPVLAHIPLGAPIEAALAAEQAGAAGLVLGPPRGAFPGPDGARVHGRLYGPALFPLALQAVEALAGRIQIPIIAGAGIQSLEQAEAMSAAGAAAVQFDCVLWTEPERVLGGASSGAHRPAPLTG